MNAPSPGTTRVGDREKKLRFRAGEGSLAPYCSFPATASQVRYVVEGTATNAAAGVAEAGVQPESTIAMSEATEAVRKIATVLPMSDELLEDAASVQHYLNGRLTLFVRLEEERQLLRGSGSGTTSCSASSAAPAINTYTKLAADDNTRRAGEGDREHGRVGVPGAGHGHHAPDELAEHPPAA